MRPRPADRPRQLRLLSKSAFRLKRRLSPSSSAKAGSGGAIAIATANRVLMLEHSIYSVISPEGCASILWRSADKVKEATEALKLTAQDLRKLGVIDEIIAEPLGGAHRDPQAAIERVGDSILKHLKELLPQSGDELKKRRTEKFLRMGRHFAESK